MKIYSLPFIALIAMNVTTQAQGTVQSQTIQSEVLRSDNAAYTNSYKGAGIPVFSTKEETKGSRYMFPKCMAGTITSTSNEKIKNEKFLFNYDKMTHKLIITEDEVNFFAVDDENVKFYTINYLGKDMIFKKVPAISENFYVEFLAGNEGGYALYKSVQTKLQKADYTSSGMIERGNNYDEFIDEFIYNVVYPDGKTVKSITLKKSSIKKSLSNEEAKVDAYFAAHKDASANEDFLKDLVKSLN